MEPDNYELSNSEITHRILDSIRREIEQSNRQIESLSYELVGSLSEISKLLEKYEQNAVMLDGTLNSIENEVSDISKGVFGLSEQSRECTNDLLSQTTRENEKRNYHPWFIVITLILIIGMFI